MEVDPIVYGDGTNYYQAYGSGPAGRVDPSVHHSRSDISRC
jgi:hypothetical protein